MRRARSSVWRRILALWVSTLLLVSGVPMVPAQAKDPLLPTSALAFAETEGSTENVAEASQSEVSAFAGGSIAQELVDADGHSYSVIVTYGEEAQIPEGAELHVGMPEDSDGALAEERAFRVERVLALGQDDRVLNATYLDVSIEANGQVVQPASAVDVRIRTDAIKPAQSSYVEVVVLGEDQDPADDEFGEACADERVESKNLTDDEEDMRDTELAFSANSLGTIAFASVATRQELWNEKGLAMSLLVPRYGQSISIVDAAAPELEEGVDPLFCRAIKAEPSPAYGTTLWLEAQPSEDEALREDEGLAGVLAYLLDDAESVPGEPLCGSEGLQEPVELSAEEELLLVWDSGYRKAKLDLADVRVEGMMPEGTQGSALDVTQAYAEPVTLMEGLYEESASAVEAGALEVATLAAYDINLQVDGEEYQPDDEHPLTVTITTDALKGALSSGKDMQVWHIADGGTVEVIKDYQLSDGAITFEATGFSTYLLVAQGETSKSEVPLSSKSGIRASAKNKATQHPIQIKNVTYPNGTPLSNTTFDLYKEDEYSTTNPGEPYMASLTAGDDGYLRNGNDTQLELSAGAYYLLQTRYAEGYARLSKAVKFTVTRDGALKVAQEDQEVAGFAYSTTVGEGTAALPVLQIPNMIPATVEVTLNVEGEHADLAREFEFALTMHEDMGRLTGTIDGKSVVFTEEASTFKLANGQTLRLEDVPATVDYVLTQTKVSSYGVLAETDTADAVTVSATDGDAFVVTLSDLNGTSSEPARVTITNAFSESSAPATGIDDNSAVWGAIVAACGVLISLLLFRHRARL